MVDSKPGCCSVGVGGEVPAGLVDDVLLPELPVVPDAGGECEQAQGDAGGDAQDGATAVAFEREGVLEGVYDRFDPLAHAAELAEPRRLASAVGRMKFACRLAMKCSNSSPANP